ncbi:MAG: aspartate kinase [Armatimonadetes bacterium]|nr:aspartate kinase [Armatimonadota bacterium]
MSLLYVVDGGKQESSAPIVAKFGGTSVASAEQIQKLAAIVRSDPRRRYVVVSAPGKRTPDDKKVTDLLYLCSHVAHEGVDVKPTFGLIRDRYEEIARDLGVEGMTEILDDVEREIIAGATEDWIASRGEYLHARLIANLLDAKFVDAGECIRFGPDGLLDPRSYPLTNQHLQGEGLFVIPGFYGLNAEGKVKTFSRGGSDVTGAIIARAMDAAVYENWTDVSGLLMADPRIIEGPRPIQEVTYRELRELSYMGANVLHDEAVFPVREANIPILIKNTNAPEDPGTRIVQEREPDENVIIGIAGKKGFTTIFVEKALMNLEHGFGRKFLEILDHFNIRWEHAPTSIDSMSVICASEEMEGKEQQVLEEIQLILDPDRVDMLHDLALIATVGIGMAHQVGIAGRLFAALAEAGINVRMINQGASEINIIVGVEAPDFEPAVRAIYKAFVKEEG